MPVDPAMVLRAWNLPQDRVLEPVESGTNNLTWRVECPVGRYVLRVYRNVGNRDHILYEHDVLQRLQGEGLSFAVPNLLPDRTGETLVSAAGTDGGENFAALFAFIPGQHPRTGDRAEAGLAGAALGELDAALAGIHPHASLPAHAMYGELDRIPGLAPNLQSVLDELQPPPDLHATLRHFAVLTEAAIPRIYDWLPRQIIHGDLGRDNVLLDGGRVTGILDFEFVAPDVRAMDLAIGMYFFGINREGDALDVWWRALESFCRGYAGHVQLTLDEIMALPNLMRLRNLVSVLHRAGRRRQGAATREDVLWRLQDAARMHLWLEQHEGELVARAVEWLMR